MLAAAQRGDEQAYTQLLTELADGVRAYLIFQFGYLETIEDYVQECLVALHHARHSYEAGRPFKPWLFAIVRHKTIDCLRRNRSRGDMLHDAPEVEWQPVDPNIEIDVGRLLDKLAEPLKMPLYLTKVQGLSTRECAHQLGISESAVKVRVHRAIRQLRTYWHTS